MLSVRVHNVLMEEPVLIILQSYSLIIHFVHVELVLLEQDVKQVIFFIQINSDQVGNSIIFI